ncbi:outer membrane lipoprotein carrier protein LolA [Spirosoma soli]|uniref:Outer membrane lipoprotein carrier protein LolA n=1 Tax=Spirosoma soli TaxID=1770529 RepID=A0ABW5MBX2_9BACT
MKKQLINLVALLAIPAFTFAQTANDILDKNIAAIGGADKIDAIKTVQYDQNMSIMGMDMTGKSSVVVGQSARTDISAMGQQITNVVDGDKGWSINPMAGGSGAQALPEDQVKQQKGNAYVIGTELATAKSKKYPVELVGKEKLNDKDVFNLKVTRPEGVINYFVDAATYQLAGAKATVSMQGQSGEISTRYANYKDTQGLQLPSTVEISSPAMPGPITLTVSNVVFNGKIDPAIFEMPKQGAAKQ